VFGFLSWRSVPGSVCPTGLCGAGILSHKNYKTAIIAGAGFSGGSPNPLAEKHCVFCSLPPSFLPFLRGKGFQPVGGAFQPEIFCHSANFILHRLLSVLAESLLVGKQSMEVGALLGIDNLCV